jgi:hypothetical protein
MRRAPGRIASGTALGIGAALVLLSPAGCSDSTSPGTATWIPQHRLTVSRVPQALRGDEFRLRAASDGTIAARSFFSHPDGDLQLLSADGTPLRRVPHEGYRFDITPTEIVTTDFLDRELRRYSHTGEPLSTTRYEGAEGQNVYTIDPVAAVPGVGIFVVDQLRRVVLRFTPEGQFLGEWGERGTGAAQFESVEDLIDSGDGNLILLDDDLWRLQKFSPDGTLVWTQDIPRSVEFGGRLAGLLARLPDGRIALADGTFYPGRISLFSPGGVLVSSWNVPEREGDGRIGIAALPDGDLVLGAFGFNGLRRFSPEGEYKGSFTVADPMLPGQVLHSNAYMEGDRGELLIYVDRVADAPPFVDVLTPEGSFGSRIVLERASNIQGTTRLIRRDDGKFLGAGIGIKNPVVEEYSPNGAILRRIELDLESGAELTAMAPAQDNDYVLALRAPRPGGAGGNSDTDAVVQLRQDDHHVVWSAVVPVPRDAKVGARSVSHVHATSAGDIFAIDVGGLIYRYDAQGRYLGLLELPSAIGGTGRPERIGSDDRGFLHVGRDGSSAITVLTPTGSFVGQYGTPEPVDSPFCYRSPRFLVTRDGAAWILSPCGDRLYRYAP